MANNQKHFSEVNSSFIDHVVNNLQEGVLFLDHNLSIVSLNNWALKVTEYLEHELLGQGIEKLFYHIENFSEVSQTIEETGCWRGEVLKRRKGGDLFSAYLNISVVPHHPTYYLAVFRDMTKEKNVKLERRLASRVLDSVNEGVIITDSQGYISYVNPAFEIVTGYNEEEVKGKTTRVLKSGIHDQEFYANFWKELLHNGKWQGEIWNKRKNGEVFPEWLSISSVKDDEGKISNFLAVFTDISEQKHSELQLQKLSHYDSLTGVANRYTLTKRLNQLIEVAGKHDQKFALLFLDLDRFKHINETLGHEFGDLLLREVCLRLKTVIKNKDTIARLGGDEFVIVQTNIKHPKEAIHLAQTIIRLFDRSFMLNNQEVFISTSIGISFFPIDSIQSEELLRFADKAMYEAKSRGRNQYELFHSNLQEHESKQIKLEVFLRKAIERNELYVVYQPKVDLITKQVVGIEALLRWKNDELGLVSPGTFIPLAEEIGMIIPLSEWVFRQACHDIHYLHLQGHSHLRVSVNVSALHFHQDDFLKLLQSIFEQANISPSCMELELTESMIMPKGMETINTLVKLKKMGLKISVDDFGTGYSSLNYLHRFPIDTLKIDKGFIRNLGVYHDDSVLVDAIITMAHKLNLSIVAEGVENRRQLKYLEEKKCDIVQGFLIAKPMPLEELCDFLFYWDGQYLE